MHFIICYATRCLAFPSLKSFIQGMVFFSRAFHLIIFFSIVFFHQVALPPLLHTLFFLLVKHQPCLPSDFTLFIPKFNSKSHNALPSTTIIHKYPSVSVSIPRTPLCVIWRTTNEILCLIQLISIIFILCMGLLNYYLRTTQNCLFCFAGMYGGLYY